MSNLVSTIVAAVLGIIDKLLGLKQAQLKDTDKIKAAKAKAVVKTDSENEKVVQQANKPGADLEELRRRASE